MEMSEETLLRIEHLVNSIALDVDRYTSNFVEGAQRSGRVMREEISKVKKETKSAGDDVDQMFDRISRQGVIRFNFFFDRVDKGFERWEMRQRQVFQEFNRHMTEARGSIGTIGEAMGASGAKGLYRGVTTVGQSLWSRTGGSTPFGGLIGLVLFGGKMEAEWAAKGQSIARAFAASTAHIGTPERQKATRDFVRYQYHFGESAGQEMAGVKSGFAEFGVSGKRAMDLASISANGFGNTIEDIAYALDTKYKSAPGTFAKAIGSAMQSSGEHIRSTTDEVLLLQQSLKGISANAPMVTGQFIQMQAAMRMQRQSLDDLRTSFLAVRRGLGEGTLKGTDSVHLTAMTMSGMQAAQRAITGLSNGLAAVVAERMSPGTNGIDAIMAFRQGMAGRGGKTFGEAAAALGAIVKENIQGNRNAQVFGGAQLIGGDVEAMRAILALSDVEEKGFETQADRDKAMQDAMADLNDVFEQRAMETSPWEKAMFKASVHMAQLATASLAALGVIASGINLLIKIGMVPFGGSKADVMKASAGAEKAFALFFSEKGIGQAAKSMRGLGDVSASMLPKGEREAARIPFDFVAEILESTYGLNPAKAGGDSLLKGAMQFASPVGGGLDKFISDAAARILAGADEVPTETGHQLWGTANARGSTPDLDAAIEHIANGDGTTTTNIGIKTKPPRKAAPIVPGGH